MKLNQLYSIDKNGNGIIKKVAFRKMVQIPSTTHATFGLYRYPAKFIPHVIAYTLGTYAQPDMKVFDPFAGYGTVGVVSKIYGNDYEMWDLNPLIEIFHKIATMKPSSVDLSNIQSKINSSDEKFIPDWSRMQNWFPKEFLPFLHKVWGYYHSLDENEMKLILTIPLLKTTRYFSFDDPQRQKLTSSSMSKKRISERGISEFLNTFGNT